MAAPKIGRRGLSLFCALALFGLAANVAKAADPDPADPYANETTEQRDARMKWFREARSASKPQQGICTSYSKTYCFHWAMSSSHDQQNQIALHGNAR